jgi:AcrR family transcriptional regulator
MCIDMAMVVSREAYFETGLEVLSDLGYGGFKLAEVCNRLGVTTGSFYHYFTSWPVYTKELIANWVQERTEQIVAAVRAETDPLCRVDALIAAALALPHGAEAAIRAWGSLDPEVHAVQVAVDQQRYDIMFDAAKEILPNERVAHFWTAWAVYNLVGFEQCTLARDADTLGWIAVQMRAALTDGRFAAVADEG